MGWKNADMTDARRGLYPEIEPYATHRLAVGDGHELHIEECGNPDGKPALFLHGGPGGGVIADYRRFFDPDAYHVVLFDQRGCGKSTPLGSVDHNTTWDLVADIERIRAFLGIDRWLVLGGSWGSTLALAYAETHPESVTEIVLRGVFLLRQREVEWFYQSGASRMFPDAWEEYVSVIPDDERDDLVRAFHRRLHGDDAVVAMDAARAWSGWELSTSQLLPREFDEPDEWLLVFAQIESHYFVNGGFLRAPNQLLDDLARIAHLPAVIVQGRYDVVCPAESAWALHRAWPGSRLELVADAGHSTKEPGIIDALVRATDGFR